MLETTQSNPYFVYSDFRICINKNFGRGNRKDKNQHPYSSRHHITLVSVNSIQSQIQLGHKICLWYSHNPQKNWCLIMLSLSISRFLKILLVTAKKVADRIYRMKKHIWLAINGLWKIDTRTAATKLLNARYSNSCHKKHKDRQKKYYDGKNLDHKPSIWWNLV